MDLPAGQKLEEGLKTSELKAESKLLSLMEARFTGYAIVTIEGYKGIEEGVLLFKQGAIIGSFYDYVNRDMEMLGDDALSRALNCLLARKGIMDVVALTEQQLDLITAFQEKILVKEPLDSKKVPRLIPAKYSENYAKQAMEGKKGEEKTRFDIFKRAGIFGVEEK